MEVVFVGGKFRSNTIDLGKGITLANDSDENYYDGMVVKYDESGEIEWAKGIAGTNDDLIKSVCETKDGEYICRRKFRK